MIIIICLFNEADSDKIKICGYSTHTYNVRPGKSVGTTPNIDKLKAMIILLRKCGTLVEEGKIDKEYEKDMKFRVRSSPLLIGWMICMATYTKILRNLPESMDRFKSKVFGSKEEQEER